jgi:hypothetical protein
MIVCQRSGVSASRSRCGTELGRENVGNRGSGKVLNANARALGRERVTDAAAEATRPTRHDDDGVRELHQKSLL